MDSIASRLGALQSSGGLDHVFSRGPGVQQQQQQQPSIIEAAVPRQETDLQKRYEKLSKQFKIADKSLRDAETEISELKGKLAAALERAGAAERRAAALEGDIQQVKEEVRLSALRAKEHWEGRVAAASSKRQRDEEEQDKE